MNIFVRVKKLGKKKDILLPMPYEIADGVSTLRQFLLEIVRTEAEKYNAKETGAQIIPFLTKEEVENQAEAGKVSFGTVYSDKKANLKQAQDNAIQCWKDGLVRVFMDDEELTELDAPIQIPENAVFTFIRLTFLTGVMW